MHEVFLESRDNVALLNNFVPTLEARSDAHTERSMASKEAGKSTLALLLFIAHVGHVVILHGEFSKVEEEIRVEGAWDVEISESWSCGLNV